MRACQRNEEEEGEIRVREDRRENVIKRDRELFGIFTSPVKNYFRASWNRHTNASIPVVAVAPASAR